MHIIGDKSGDNLQRKRLRRSWPAQVESICASMFFDTTSWHRLLIYRNKWSIWLQAHSISLFSTYSSYLISWQSVLSVSNKFYQSAVTCSVDSVDGTLVQCHLSSVLMSDPKSCIVCRVSLHKMPLFFEGAYNDLDFQDQFSDCCFFQLREGQSLSLAWVLLFTPSFSVLTLCLFRRYLCSWWSLQQPWIICPSVRNTTSPPQEFARHLVLVGYC